MADFVKYTYILIGWELTDKSQRIIFFSLSILNNIGKMQKKKGTVLLFTIIFSQISSAILTFE